MPHHVFGNGGFGLAPALRNSEYPATNHPRLAEKVLNDEPSVDVVTRS